MSRVKNSVATRARRKRVLKLAKGYFGRKSTVYKTANQAVIKSAMYAYRDRRNKKRNFRKLWIDVYKRQLLYRLVPLLPALAVGILILVLRKRLSAILVPLFAAILLAYMLNPAVDFVQKRIKFMQKKSRGKAVALVFLVFLLCAVSAAAFLLPAIASNLADIIENAQEIRTRLLAYAGNLISEEHAGLRGKAAELINSFADRIDVYKRQE